MKLDCGYRTDLIVDERVLVEAKAVEQLTALHDAQLLSCLKLSGLNIGLLINFNVRILTHGEFAVRSLARRRTSRYSSVGSAISVVNSSM